jgi:DNA polymerase-3 subunit epsilon
MATIDFDQSPTEDQVGLVSDWLQRANYRVIRPLNIRTQFSADLPPEDLITVAILDTETTGVIPEKDKIIELGIVLVQVCPKTGRAFSVTKVFDELEDPGFPIPEESTRIHNISNEMVAGKRINDRDIEALISNVALVVAHNAGFDRVFVENRFPIFATKAWACSFRQIPWGEEGIGSAKLEFLAYTFGFHYTGHRASTDCHALLEVLQNNLPISDQVAMHALLSNASFEDIKISALGSPFDSKDRLKERHYRWNPERKIWHKTVPKQDLDAEVSWLKQFVYAGKKFSLEFEKMNAMNRYSNRSGQSEVVTYG